MPNIEAGRLWPSAETVRMREQFEIYSDGLFSLPLNIPGTPYGKAVEARRLISADIERESPLICSTYSSPLICSTYSSP